MFPPRRLVGLLMVVVMFVMLFPWTRVTICSSSSDSRMMASFIVVIATVVAIEAAAVLAIVAVVLFIFLCCLCCLLSDLQERESILCEVIQRCHVIDRAVLGLP